MAGRHDSLKCLYHHASAQRMRACTSSGRFLHIEGLGYVKLEKKLFDTMMGDIWHASEQDEVVEPGSGRRAFRPVVGGQ